MEQIYNILTEIKNQEIYGGLAVLVFSSIIVMGNALSHLKNPDNKRDYKAYLNRFKEKYLK